MKTVAEVLTNVKGSDKVNDVLTGKGAFSKAGFSDVVSAMANDTTYKVKTYDKNGKENGAVNISELIRNDLKKTLEKAKYPQKTEAGVLDTCEIVTAGLAEAIPHIIEEQLKCGKKMDLPQQPTFQGSIYLANVPGKVKTSNVRDPKTQENLGTVTTTTKDSVQIRTKSQVPASCVVSKVRKDPSGKVVN